MNDRIGRSVLLIAMAIFSGCKRESGDKNAAATQPANGPVAQRPADPPPNMADVLEHLQRMVNDSANSADVFSEKTRQLDAIAKQDFLTRLSANWSGAKPEWVDPNSKIEQFRAIKGVIIYRTDSLDHVMLARIVVLSNSPTTVVRILDDPRFAAFRFLIDSPNLSEWIDQHAQPEAKH